MSARPAAVAVGTLAASDVDAWDGYVRAHPHATFFHQLGWKRVLERTFGYRAHYFVARRGERVCGVLPLFACRSLRGRTSLLSLPHTVYGGPVGDDAEAERALLAAARELGGHALELRNRHPNRLDLPPLGGFVTFEKDLPADVYRSLPKKAREAVNQARKRHRLEADFAGGLDEFYDLLAAAYLRLGTPVFPRRFFAAMLEEFPDAASILLVRHEGRPVSGVLSMVFRKTMMPLYSGEAPGVGNLKTGNFKYFRLMEHARELALERFDFGRSRADNPGVVRFKENQGFTAEPLPYQSEGGGGGNNPNQGFFLKARRIWCKLPGPVAKFLGPRVVRYFP